MTREELIELFSSAPHPEAIIDLFVDGEFGPLYVYCTPGDTKPYCIVLSDPTPPAAAAFEKNGGNFSRERRGIDPFTHKEHVIPRAARLEIQTPQDAVDFALYICHNFLGATSNTNITATISTKDLE